MSNKILITWSNSWIWNYISSKLSENNTIIWVWRWENNLDWIKYIKWDLKDLNILQEIVKSSDNFDYVIINAWVWYFDKFEKIWLEKHRETIETNLLSPILLLQLLLEESKIKKWIVFIWSIAWKKSLNFWSSYAASKFGLRWLAMQLKNELKWIKVHIINPSIVCKNEEYRKQNIESIKNYVISSKVERSVEELNNEIWKSNIEYKKQIPPPWSEWQLITLKNNFEHFWSYKKTTLDDILKVVQDIILWSENRFEIDL